MQLSDASISFSGNRPTKRYLTVYFPFRNSTLILSARFRFPSPNVTDRIIDESAAMAAGRQRNKLRNRRNLIRALGGDWKIIIIHNEFLSSAQKTRKNGFTALWLIDE